MLILILAAALAQEMPVARGPFVDLSTGESRAYADKGSIRRTGDHAALVVTVARPDGFRSEHDYRFDCAARTYTDASWRALDADGRVVSRHHAQTRPSSRPVDSDSEPYRALACDGDAGGRAELAELPR